MIDSRSKHSVMNQYKSFEMIMLLIFIQVYFFMYMNTINFSFLLKDYTLKDIEFFKKIYISQPLHIIIKIIQKKYP